MTSSYLDSLVERIESAIEAIPYDERQWSLANVRTPLGLKFADIVDGDGGDVAFEMIGYNADYVTLVCPNNMLDLLGYIKGLREEVDRLQDELYDAQNGEPL